MKAKYFDPEKTLEKIAQVFAKHGYEGTSLDAIIRATGVGKQSLYNAFGDKKSMIAKSLECFGKKSEGAKILNCKDMNGRQKIDAFFNATFTECKESGGCLIANQLLEKGGTDKEVLKLASGRWEQTRATLEAVIEEGIKDKSIKKTDSEMASYTLINILNGLRITSRAAGDIAKVKKMVKMNLDLIL